jgi:3-isopropylmalate/(R)-2-methylmalate dehydratase small subunit
MEKFTSHRGIVAPLDRENVDTDAIIPKQFLKSIRRTGFGPNLFDEWRYLDRCDDGQPGAARIDNPDFVLNQPRYRQATILLCRKNFGCGSSREHAPWALQQYGFKVLIAPGFADIFFNNCFKNGLLPVVLSESQVEQLFQLVASDETCRLSVDLSAQTVTAAQGLCFSFEVAPFRKFCLLNGYDDVALTLNYADRISAFETARRATMPWMMASLQDVAPV